MRTPLLHTWNKALKLGIVASQRPESVMTAVFLAATPFNLRDSSNSELSIQRKRAGGGRKCQSVSAN